MPPTTNPEDPDTPCELRWPATTAPAGGDVPALARSHIAQLLDDTTAAPTGSMGLATRAARTHGVFTTADVSAHDLTENWLRRRIEDGTVIRVAIGVHRFTAAPVTWRQGLHLALALAGPEAVVSHRTAAALHGLEGFRPGPVEVTVPRNSRRRTRTRRSHTTHESVDLHPSDVTGLDDVPITRLERTFVDLGAVVPEARVEAAFDDAVRRLLVDPRDVAQRYRELSRRGRRGCGPIRRILERRDPSAQLSNTFEKRFLALIRAAGLPDPIAQHHVRVDGRDQYLDFAWPQLRLAVECDSLAYHFGRKRLAWDDSRQNRLVLAGWVVLRFTWDDLVNHPERVVREVERALSKLGWSP